MTIDQWIEENREEIERRYEELKAENPGAVIVKPGWQECLDGTRVLNPQFIIAK